MNKLEQGDFQNKFIYFIVFPGLPELHLELHLYFFQLYKLVMIKLLIDFVHNILDDLY